jgi:hypothetical protein
MARNKEENSIDQLKDTLKYAEKCRDIQSQILDYCVKLANRKEPINKMEIVEDLRAIVMWDEQ